MGGYGMTREEEIINAGVEYTESRRPMCIGGQSYGETIFQMNRNHAFEDGAKWADCTMTEKVCDWIKTHIEEYYTYDVWKGDCIDVDALINDLKTSIEK